MEFDKYHCRIYILWVPTSMFDQLNKKLKSNGVRAGQTLFFNQIKIVLLYI